jgi:hypothetical protein
MALNPTVTNTPVPIPAKAISSYVADNKCDYMIDQLYNVNQQRYKKYKKATKKYLTMNASTNPNINSPDNTTYYIKNESEHSKNSAKLYKNNTHWDYKK